MFCEVGLEVVCFILFCLGFTRAKLPHVATDNYLTMVDRFVPFVAAAPYDIYLRLRRGVHANVHAIFLI